jgi:hypothetical protein
VRLGYLFLPSISHYNLLGIISRVGTEFFDGNVGELTRKRFRFVIVRKNSKIRFGLLVAAFAVTGLYSTFVAAQEEDRDTPLGDVARSFRKKVPSSQETIDNDNLAKVMDQVESHRLSATSLRYSISAGGKSFQVSAPDVTCSLAFNANAKALLSSQYVQVDLPGDEIPKLEGPAILDGDSLQVSIFNGTDWHISEVAVALTVLKKADGEGPFDYGTAKLLPVVPAIGDQEADSRFQKRSDVTVVYRIRAAAAPAATTIFRAPLNMDIGPDQEWHWAIVQAKGYPPQASSVQTAQFSPRNVPEVTPDSTQGTDRQPVVSPAFLTPAAILDSPANPPSASSTLNQTPTNR